MKHTEISTRLQLANYLRCDESFLKDAIEEEYNINDISIEFSQTTSSAKEKIIVDKFYIKKKGKSGGTRDVHSVRDFRLSYSLRILNSYLSDIFTPKKNIHGFIKGRNIKTNATPHLGKKTLLSLDIKDYFDSITKEMVSKGLISIGFKKDIAEYLSNITTIEGHLVQGFNTSPIIANIVSDPMDKELISLCGKEIEYTRYADDLTFSTNNDLPDINQIKSILGKYGFKLNVKKTKVMKRGHFQFVTGLTVFDEKTPRIPKKIKRNIRLEIFFIDKFGYQKHAIRRLKNSGLDVNSGNFKEDVDQEILETQHRLFGWIHYIKSIEPVIADKLYKTLIKCKR